MTLHYPKANEIAHFTIDIWKNVVCLNDFLLPILSPTSPPPSPLCTLITMFSLETIKLVPSDRRKINGFEDRMWCNAIWFELRWNLCKSRAAKHSSSNYFTFCFVHGCSVWLRIQERGKKGKRITLLLYDEDRVNALLTTISHGTWNDAWRWQCYKGIHSLRIYREISIIRYRLKRFFAV